MFIDIRSFRSLSGNRVGDGRLPPSPSCPSDRRSAVFLVRQSFFSLSRNVVGSTVQCSAYAQQPELGGPGPNQRWDRIKNRAQSPLPEDVVVFARCRRSGRGPNNLFLFRRLLLGHPPYAVISCYPVCYNPGPFSGATQFCMSSRSFSPVTHWTVRRRCRLDDCPASGGDSATHSAVVGAAFWLGVNPRPDVRFVPYRAFI